MDGSGLSHRSHAGLVKVEKQDPVTEQAGLLEPGCIASATSYHFVTAEVPLQLDCHLHSFSTESSTTLANHVKENAVSHLEVAHCDLQGQPDASLHLNTGSWRENSDTGDLGDVRTSFGSDVNFDVVVAGGQGAVHVGTTVGTSHKKCFSCHLCPYTSTHKSSLTKHIRTHIRKDC